MRSPCPCRMTERKHVLVTGATGLIGRAFTRLAVSQGYQVAALIRDPLDPRVPRHPNVKAYTWTPERAGVLPPDVPGGAPCVHLAAFTPPDLHDAAFADQCLRVNALATEALVDAVGRRGRASFIYASGGSLYLNQGGRPVSERDSVYPSLHAPYYTLSKLAGEIFAQVAAERQRIPVCTLRIASVYGPGMRRTAVVPRFLESASQHKTLRVTEPDRSVDF